MTVTTIGATTATTTQGHTVIVNEVILPRKYQEEIFRRAQEHNIIAALDTGSGKTLISILLIKWVVLQPSAIGKVVVFLVPKVALVEQQAEFITSQTPLRVRKFHGSLDLELSDRANWKSSFEKADVVVMTGEVTPVTGDPGVVAQWCPQHKYSSTSSPIHIGGSTKCAVLLSAC